MLVELHEGGEKNVRLDPNEQLVSFLYVLTKQQYVMGRRTTFDWEILLSDHKINESCHSNYAKWHCIQFIIYNLIDSLRLTKSDEFRQLHEFKSKARAPRENIAGI